MQASTPPVHDERHGLLTFLAQQRNWAQAAAFGLDEAQARSTPTASSLCVGGLVKHLAAVERSWSGMVLGTPPGPLDFASYLEGFRLGPDETLAGVLESYAEAAGASDRVFASADLEATVPVPEGWFWVGPDVKSWTVRWVMLHLIEETARHAGHADIIRESIDGAQSTPLMAALDGWPDLGWVKPWQPGVVGAVP